MRQRAAVDVFQLAAQRNAVGQAAGLDLTLEDSRILVCGNPQMLDDVRDALFARGLRPDRSAVPGPFATENYW